MGDTFSCNFFLCQWYHMISMSNVGLSTCLSCSLIWVGHWRWEKIPIETMLFTQTVIYNPLLKKWIIPKSQGCTIWMKKFCAPIFQCYIFVSCASIYKQNYLMVFFDWSCHKQSWKITSVINQFLLVLYFVRKIFLFLKQGYLACSITIEFGFLQPSTLPHSNTVKHSFDIFLHYMIILLLCMFHLEEDCNINLPHQH